MRDYAYFLFMFHDYINDYIINEIHSLWKPWAGQLLYSAYEPQKRLIF